MEALLPLLIVVGFILLISLRQINQYQRGVMFTMGKYSGTKNPGWRLRIPVFQQMRVVDMRVKAVDVPDQKAITRDNIPVAVSAVIFYKIANAENAVLAVENFYYAMSQLAQTTMRNIVGEVELDQLLAGRETISNRIREIVSESCQVWGIQVDNVELKDVALPADMERTIAKQAEAEREKRAVIIRAEGEVASAENMVKAATMLANAPGALHLRTLQSINDLSSDQSNTILFMVPLEVLKTLGTDKNGVVRM